VVVSAAGKLIYHQSLSECSFARYVRYKRSGQSQKESTESKSTADECLSLALNCSCSELTVKLIFGYTSTSLPAGASKDSSPPETLAEFYGEPAAEEQDAVVDYQARAEEWQLSATAQGAKQVRVGRSTPMLVLPVAGRPQEAQMLPLIIEKKPASPAEGASGAKKEPSKTQSAADHGEQIEEANNEAAAVAAPLELAEVQLEEIKTNQSGPLSELRDLQQQLREAMKRRR